ncbi:MAG: hypothetical protein KGS09_16800 [Nitrospirae bacterium]|nr:hypothetical protein [Nitrospirota bacterium]MDE3039110.1 hypothetical protein [Nitrospirota bacterium]MDE3219782.1 hypothetical protein [Nitrospirota bacterium]
MNARKWMMEYGVAMVLTFLFAVILGHIPLFRETTIGKLHASDLVQFIGYGGALVIVWFGARQLAAEPPDDWKWLMPYRALILPVTTLAIMAISYGVLLYVCDPFLSKSGKVIYNWMFIIGIVATSAWLIVTWVRKCAPQVAAVESRRLRKQAA